MAIRALIILYKHTFRYTKKIAAGFQMRKGFVEFYS